MEQILEIRDGCSTPAQLLKSLAFAKYLNIYKMEFIRELQGRDERQRSEAQQKIGFIEHVGITEIVALLDEPAPTDSEQLEKARALVRFLDGAYHHFRSTAYSRLVRLQNAVVSSGSETPDTVKDKVTEKSQALSDLILETRRQLMQKVGLEVGVRRTWGMDATPNVTAGEISGHYLNLPADYTSLAHVPLTIAADIKTGVDYSTPSNKRANPFYELDYNPFNESNFVAKEWVSVPLQVGRSLIVAYINKSRGSIEMEPGLLNLFPFASIDEIKSNRRPDGIFIFGDPNAGDNDLGYFWDEKNQMLIGMVPDRDELKYFGYSKKPILTLHNVLAIRNGEMPLHCGCTRNVVRFDGEGEPYIAEMVVKADDMGRVALEKGDDNLARLMFFGTETGAFACLDGFSEHAKTKMIGQEVGYNKETGSNARQIVPVTDEAEVAQGHVLDALLYMNNFALIEEGECTVDTNMSVETAIEHFRLGERVAAGSTKTHRGAKESSYWANPFPLLVDNDGTVLHPDLYEKYKENEGQFIGEMKALADRGEMRVGVAHSQLMAGVYSGNSDEDLTRCGYGDRDDVEQVAPVRLGQDLIHLIKQCGREKRDRLGGNVEEVNITIALVGDSRTGKSETAEKMEGILSLSLI
ncbi:hypothetical protein BOW53_14055 [Solemya pervernicosa gill symbiont]|uniref:Uncharacterized protein n=2 Tax=Gammaproteobacteria incertae sedis TaxID=118884 RepID=A0A1T2L1K1_9GAMM|nr:hypothetical protein [Candidatus Reidiella endopervernicosa]OOZ38826.1 hypothetical protein BOW53_14055 [Solemya pervernicosa gill symbiont]QKQ27428.1 hypothetical protein HUE57_14905 [Candidatus Reidiella endopervernicosa]